MIHIPGAGPTFAELAGLESRADRIAHLGGFGRANYTRSQDSPFEVMDLIVSLDRDLPFRGNALGSSTDTPIADDNPLNFQTQFNYFRQSDNRVLAVLTIQADNDELTFSNSGGIETARLNIFGRVTSVANRRVGRFEDTVTTTATSAELSTTRTRKSAYAKALVLDPGRYRVDVAVRDITSGAAGFQQVGFVVPEFPLDQLSASSIVLAAKLENMESGAAIGPFVIGTTKVIPNLTATYRRNEPVGVYLQIYNAAIDQTTLRPAADAVYVLLKNGKEVSRHVEDWRQMNDAGQRLTLARLIDSRTLEPGEYQIEIRIRDQVSGQTIIPTATFKIVP
ncbi:MAG TPA: hypothetical protein VFR78_16470 [Pyrinomonadaceae bacterium]|nr:hypothetical protein [Pyrinomonadaceae bacterium]